MITKSASSARSTRWKTPGRIAVLALLACAGACSDGGKDETSAGSTGASATTTTTTTGESVGETEATTSSGISDASASATTTSTSDATTTATSTTGATTSTATSDATDDVTTDVTTGPRACESIVGSMECEALAEVSIDLTFEECLLCQGAPCGAKAICDGQYPCVDGVIVLRGCCQDLECEGLAPFCGMYLGTNDICVLSDDI